MEIPERYGLGRDFEGVPAILVVSPGGTLVNRGHEEALAEARNMTPQAIVDWIAQWTE
jgi:hypothetical protein